ncbi:MAG: trypsin-like serine protease [Bacteroidota bacterium]
MNNSTSDLNYFSIGNKEISPHENTITNGQGSLGLVRSSFFPEFPSIGDFEKIPRDFNWAQDTNRTKNVIRIDPTGFMETETRVHDTDDREEVFSIQYPYNCICLLEIEGFNGTNRQSTGFFVSPKCILTAGHCVNDPITKNWATRIRIIPCALKNLEPFGSEISTKFRSVSGWIKNRDYNYDYGAIILPNENLFNRIKAYLAFEKAGTEKKIEIAGYPTNKGKTLFTSEDQIQRKSQNKLFYLLDTYHGNSGSPIMVDFQSNKTVIGIHTYGGNPNSGILLSQGVINRIQEWMML